VLGLILGTAFDWRGRMPQQPALWVVFILLYSYVLLIPGLGAGLTWGTMRAHVGLIAVCVNPPLNECPGSGSLLKIIQQLWENQLYGPCIVITTCATIVPPVKLLLLFWGSIWRSSPDASKVQRASQCFYVVQVISKWACPDMFAYILVIHLKRIANLSVDVLEGYFLFGVGFTCFSVFCVISTCTAQAFELPTIETEGAAEVSPGHRSLVSSAHCRQSGNNSFVAGVCSLAFIFGMLMTAGIFVPCMGFHFQPENVVQTALGIRVDTDVTLWTCILGLLQAVRGGEANSLLALVMLLVFVIGFTVLDVVALMVTAVKLHRDSATSETMPSDTRALASWTTKLKHISMLDVAIVGFLVCIGGSRQSPNARFWPRAGLWLLFCAEVTHYMIYRFVKNAFDENRDTKA
jgi:uncharacterized paraquat-inducible protein A